MPETPPGPSSTEPLQAPATAPFDATLPWLLVFSDDWGRHPSSCQHLIRELLPRYRVLWVNTIGTRRPRLDAVTLRRAAGKIAGWLAASRRSGDRGAAGPRVIDPVMWPSFGSRFGRALNRRLLARAVTRALPRGAPVVGLTTVPLMADLVGRLSVERWVYYCVDDLGEWPGLDGPALRLLERELLARVDAVVAVSESLQRRLAELGREAALLTHGVDLGHWSRPAAAEPPEIAGLPRPLLVFWGVVDRRLDVAWLRRLGERLTAGTILLVGPDNGVDPELAAVPRLAWPGALPYGALPALGQAMAVAIMPYRDMAATRALQPLKLKEYLATGKPVVASELPATVPWRDACDIAASAERFAELVLERLGSGLPEEQRRARLRLAAESWSAKAAELERVLRSAVAGPRPDGRPRQR